MYPRKKTEVRQEAKRPNKRIRFGLEYFFHTGTAAFLGINGSNEKINRIAGFSLFVILEKEKKN